jgi:hypothetical protein
MKALMLLAPALLAAQAAEPTGTLTLACEGTKINWVYSAKTSEPVSAGLVIDFPTGTISGFPYSLEAIVIQISKVDDALIIFKYGGTYLQGFINRVTGELEAETTVALGYQHQWSLKCKPTQRMF